MVQIPEPKRKKEKTPDGVCPFLKLTSIFNTIAKRTSKLCIYSLNASSILREYAKNYESLTKRYQALQKRYTALTRQREDKQFKADELSGFLFELGELYYNEGRAYKYVESFLKMFYLIFGQAYSRNYLDVDRYNTLCVNKNTKIHMPKMKIDEDDEIVSFSVEETDALDKYFNGTNAETAYMLGRYCGLRINECYGLLWSNIDFNNDRIHIEQQMQYQEGLITLSPLKTRTAKCTLYMNSKLKAYSATLHLQQTILAIIVKYSQSVRFFIA